MNKTRKKVPSSRQDLLTSRDTHHEACCSFVARCFHGLRLNLGVSTKPESTQMRMSNAYIWHVTPDQSSPAEVWLVQGKSRQEKQLRSNASLQPALQPPPWHSTPSDWCFSPSTSAYVRSYGISPKSTLNTYGYPTDNPDYRYHTHTIPCWVFGAFGGGWGHQQGLMFLVLDCK